MAFSTTMNKRAIPPYTMKKLDGCIHRCETLYVRIYDAI